MAATAAKSEKGRIEIGEAAPYIIFEIYRTRPAKAWRNLSAMGARGIWLYVAS